MELLKINMINVALAKFLNDYTEENIDINFVK